MSLKKSNDNVAVATMQPIEKNALGGSVRVLKARKLSHFITESEITTDSIVAKVRIVTGDSTRRIFIDWGDLKSDVISIRPGLNIDLAPVFGTPNPLPNGTYEIFHAYDEPEEKQAFERNVTIRIQDHSGNIDQQSKTITLTAKYKVTVYRASVRLLDPCDIGGQSGEFEITQNINGNDTRRWEWAPSNNFFSDSQYHLLPNSQFAQIWEVGGPNIYYKYYFVEKDGFLNADDKGIHRKTINYLTESGRVENDVKVSDPTWGSCKVRIRYDVEVILVKPLPSIGGMATFAKA